MLVTFRSRTLGKAQLEGGTMTRVIDARGAAAGAARGVVFIHSCPRAVTSHLAWALAKVFGSEVDPDWRPQPVDPDTLRCELIWSGRAGTGAVIASTLAPFRTIRMEVTEDPSPGRDGERYSSTPVLGLHRATIGMHGDVMLTEDRLKAALTKSMLGMIDLGDEVLKLLGKPWDEELEPFRCAHEDSTVRVLHHVV
jgi:hypothetical protein